MKTDMAKIWSTKLVILASIVCFIGAAATVSSAQIAGASRAVVEAIQGDATVITGPDEEPARLAVGSTVNAWNMVNVNGSSKLFLRWGTGLFNSLGEYSSMFLASTDTPNGPVDAIQITEGVLRVATQSNGSSTPYVVTTPTASVEPVSYDEPVDFFVEVYSPKTSAVTVISGRVRVRNTTLQSVETLVNPCQSAFVEEGKSDFGLVFSTPTDLNRIVANTTIPNTLVANFQCPVPPAPPRVAQPPVQYVEYEYEDWESYDIYPYEEITILPPEPGIGCVVILPGIGRWIIPIEVFAGWRFDPVIIGTYCRHVILDHMIYRDHYYLADARLRQTQLRHLIYLAQISGNRSMLLDAQRQLADLNVQSRWAAMRLSRLEKKVAGLDQEQHKFANKLPQGKNLLQTISNSFNSPKNLAVSQNFRDRIKTELNVQGQLAGMAGRELVDLRSKISREKNPQVRLALTDEFHKISKDVNQGKLPIPAKDTQVKQALDRFKKEQDPQKLQGIQKELTQLTKVEAPRTSELLNQKNLATLKQDIAKLPNAQVRSNLEAQVGQLQQSVEATKAAELNREKIDAITAQAAQEPNAQKRNELLGQIKELAKPAAGAAGLVGGLNLLQKRQALESQLSLEQDKQQRGTLEKALEEQRMHQTESLRQQLDRGKQADLLRQQQEELKKRAEPKHLEEERLKQTDQARQQQLEQQKLLRQQELQKQQAEQKGKQEELQKQTEQKRLEEERLKQADRVRQQQFEQQKLLQKQKEEELRKQTEEKRHLEQVEKQKQFDEQRLKAQQEEQHRRQIETDRARKLEQEQMQPRRLLEQSEEARRKQQEAETLRRQQERNLQLQRQQEQGLQLRRQQEQTEQMRHQQQQLEQQRTLQQQHQQQQLLQQQRQQQMLQQQQHQQQQQLQQQRQLQLQQQQEEEKKRKNQPPSPPIR